MHGQADADTAALAAITTTIAAAAGGVSAATLTMQRFWPRPVIDIVAVANGILYLVPCVTDDKADISDTSGRQRFNAVEKYRFVCDWNELLRTRERKRAKPGSFTAAQD